MTDKQLAIDTLEKLSADATRREIRDRIEFLAAIKVAEDAVERGEVIPHDEEEKKFASWVRISGMQSHLVKVRPKGLRQFAFVHRRR